MPAEVVHIIDPDGGPGTDYPSLAAWNLDQARDLVAADEIAVAECRSTGGTADTEDFEIDDALGWVTDATRGIIIRNHESEFPSRVWSNSKYRMVVDSTTTPYCIRVLVPFVEIHNLQFAGGYIGCIRALVGDTPGLSLHHNIFRANGSHASLPTHLLTLAMNAGTPGDEIFVYNNLFLFVTLSVPLTAGVRRGIHGNGSPAATAPDVYVENNTFVSCSDKGIENDLTASYAWHLKNNLFYLCGSGDPLQGTFSDSDYNSTDRAAISDGGANSLISQTFTFLNSAGLDYALDATDSGALNNGDSLANLECPITDDIDLFTRPATGVDIGCSERIVPTTYYWVGTDTGYFEDAENWALTSGGLGGNGPPNVYDNVIFDENSLGSAVLTQDLLINSIDLEEGYLGVFDFNGFDIYVTDYVVIGSDVNFTGYSGATWTILGDLFIGGPETFRLIAPDQPWVLDVAGTAEIEFSIISNVIATNEQVWATTSQNAGDTENVNFIQGLSCTFEGPVTVLAVPRTPTLFIQESSRTGAQIDWLDNTKFKLTVDGQIINFSTNKFRMEDLSFSYDGKEVRFTEATTPTHGTPTYDINDSVTLEMDFGTGLECFFRGKIMKTGHKGQNNKHAVSYTALGYQNLAGEVDTLDPAGLVGEGFDGPSISIPGAIQRLFNSNVGQLSSVGVPSTIGSPGLDTIYGYFTRSGANTGNSQFAESVKGLLKESPTKRLFWDDVQNKWTFPDLQTAPLINMPISSAAFDNNDYQKDLGGRYTAIVLIAPFEGSYLMPDAKVINLTPGWDAAFAADWTFRKGCGVGVPANLATNYAWVYRRWKFESNSSPAQSDQPVNMFVLIPMWNTFRWFPVECFIDWKLQHAITKLPIIVKGNPHKPGDQVPPLAAALAYWDATSVPSTGTSQLRYPASGYTGTAYSMYGVQKVKYMTVEANQLNVYYAAEQLAALKDVIINAEIPINGDPIREFINLNRKVNVTHSTNITGLESLEAFQTSYKYTFGRPGTSTISVSNDRSIITRSK